MRALIVLVIAGVVAAPAARAQQVLEIDTAAGRVILDDEWRAIRTIEDMPLDRTRALLYANDDEEPEGVMVFSLETGEWIRTIPTLTGGGPRELERGMSGMTLGRDGRLYVSGYVRVLEFDPLGQYVRNWRPGADVVWDVCEFDGQPAIVARGGGVIRRGPEGTDEALGRDIVDRRAASIRDTPVGRGRVISGSRPRIACTDDAAYVVTTNAETSDSVFVYHRSGETTRLPVPTEFTDRGDGCKVKVDMGHTELLEMSCSNWARELEPTLDAQGNLVLLGRDQEVPGAIIDPDTGCYAVVRKPAPSRTYDAHHVYRDSVLVFRYSVYEAELPPGFEMPAGATATAVSISTAADRMSLHPLRRISGEPCPGMLESLN
ncbi:MAG: hypothetical protein OXQ94_09785 [Gemmatimonadota bacterium]|nr:hypothetical protein [Gemmatimonadota bacterium]MDE2871958.1 hypothetical protein [Gemmatimonadota bacterium]